MMLSVLWLLSTAQVTVPGLALPAWLVRLHPDDDLEEESYPFKLGKWELNPAFKIGAIFMPGSGAGHLQLLGCSLLRCAYS